MEPRRAPGQQTHGSARCPQGQPPGVAVLRARGAHCSFPRAWAHSTHPICVCARRGESVPPGGAGTPCQAGRACRADCAHHAAGHRQASGAGLALSQEGPEGSDSQAVAMAALWAAPPHLRSHQGFSESRSTAGLEEASAGRRGKEARRLGWHWPLEATGPQLHLHQPRVPPGCTGPPELAEAPEASASHLAPGSSPGSSGTWGWAQGPGPAQPHHQGKPSQQAPRAAPGPMPHQESLPWDTG